MEYKSNVTLGRKYKDTIHGIEGVAVVSSFFQYGCERVSLQWREGETINEMPFDAPALKAVNFSAGEIHHSDIILGEEYQDEVTGIKGKAVAVTFFIHSCERVTLEWVEKKQLHDETFDAPRLKAVSSGAKAETQKTGGPMRGTSHVRRGPVGR